MKIKSFVKRLNATELGLGATHDAYIAIPSEVDLSFMLEHQKVLNPINRYSGGLYKPDGSDFKYVQTGQNNQERISGLGEFYVQTDAKVGDEILIEKIENNSGAVQYYIDLRHRHAIVFQVNSIKGKRCVDILPNDLIEDYANGVNYDFDVIYNGAYHILEVKFLAEAKKKITSPCATKFYDLLIDGESILPGYSYQEYIELVTDGMRLGRMKTYCYSILKMMEDKDE